MDHLHGCFVCFICVDFMYILKCSLSILSFIRLAKSGSIPSAEYSQKSATRLRGFVLQEKCEFSSIAYARWGEIVFSADGCAHQTEALPANHSVLHFLAWNKRIDQHTKQNQRAVIVRKERKRHKNPNTGIVAKWEAVRQRQHYAKNGTIITDITK